MFLRKWYAFRFVFFSANKDHEFLPILRFINEFIVLFSSQQVVALQIIYHAIFHYADPEDSFNNPPDFQDDNKCNIPRHPRFFHFLIYDLQFSLLAIIVPASFLYRVSDISSLLFSQKEKKICMNFNCFRATNLECSLKLYNFKPPYHASVIVSKIRFCLILI